MLVTSVKGPNRTIKLTSSRFQWLEWRRLATLSGLNLRVRAINVARDAASTAIPSSCSTPIQLGGGDGRLSHWFHGSRGSFAIFRTACSLERLISWDTRGSLSLSFPFSLLVWFFLSFSLRARNALSRGPCALPDSFPFVGNNAPLPNTTDLWPLSRGFLLLSGYLSRPFPPRAKTPLCFSDVAVG